MCLCTLGFPLYHYGGWATQLVERFHGCIDLLTRAPYLGVPAALCVTLLCMDGAPGMVSFACRPVRMLRLQPDDSEGCRSLSLWGCGSGWLLMGCWHHAMSVLVRRKPAEVLLDALMQLPHSD